MASTTGRRVVEYLTNKSGGAVAAGDVVVIDTTNNEAFTTSTSGGFTGMVGVAQEAIANNAAGRVLTAGYAALVTPNASVTRGNYGKTHTVAKQATDAGASRTAGAFCQFLTGGTTPSAHLFGLVDSSTSSSGVPSGTSFPGSPSTDDLYYRSDRDILYEYDGTRWVTVTLYEWNSHSASVLSASALAAVYPLITYDIWVVDFGFTYIVQTTHSGTQYWEAKFSDSAGGNATTLTTDKATTGSWLFPAATAVGAAITISKSMQINITKVSTPGTLLAGYRVRYRLIG